MKKAVGNQDFFRCFTHRLPIYNGIDTDQHNPEVPVLHRPDTNRTLVDEVVSALRSEDTAVRPIWLPPLSSRLTLGRVLDEENTDPLRVIVGLEDDPSHQRQKPWMLDLASSGGHVAIIGSPQSGRTTLLRTIAASLALTTTPREVTLYPSSFVCPWPFYRPCGRPAITTGPSREANT